MKPMTAAPEIDAWPYGVEVVASSQGILLKARPKPRQGWREAFKRSETEPDETSSLRDVQNQFDAKEWEW